MVRIKLPPPTKVLRSQRGVALLLALVTFSLLTYIAMEVSYDSSVDYSVSKQQVDRVRARYAAKAGLEIGLLRVKLYKQAVASFGAQVPAAMLDTIWQFPFMWPPTAAADVPGTKLSEADKAMLQDSVEDSLMQGQYSVTIAPEGGRMDINDLGSELKGFQKLMYNQVLKIFQSQLQQNDEFRDKYSGYNFEQLVANIADYVDEDTLGYLGGDESAPYRDVTDRDALLPPNRSLRTLDELHMVAGMTEDFYRLLASRVTVYGSKGINVNYAPKDTLMALDPTMTDEAADRVIARRTNPQEGGPFRDEADFFGFLQRFGVNTQNLQQSKFPLFFGIEFNFRVSSTGISGNARREITAVTFDFANVTQRYIERMNIEDQANGLAPIGSSPSGVVGGGTSGSGAPVGGGGSTTVKITPGRPNVVSWEEN